MKWVPKISVNVGYGFELRTFRPTVANKSEIEVCLELFVIDTQV